MKLVPSLSKLPLAALAGLVGLVACGGMADPVPQPYVVEEDTTLSVDADSGVLARDGISDSELTLTISVPPEHGSIVLANDGSFEYVPAQDYHGPDQFTYEVISLPDVMFSSTVEITVTPVDDPPVVGSGFILASPGSERTLAILEYCVDIEGDPLSITAVGQPANGTSRLNSDGTVGFTPAAGASGVDQFSFTISDGRDSYDGTITVFTPEAFGGESEMKILVHGGNSNSTEPRLSGNGRLIAFTTERSLVPEDTNGVDIYVIDRASGDAVLVSVAEDGTPSNGDSRSPEISMDGRIVAFRSSASNLVSDDANGEPDVFVRDLDAGGLELISRSTAGTPGNAPAWGPMLSADGRFVVFVSQSTNLVEEETPAGRDHVYLRDRQTDTTTLIARGSSPSISADGRYVMFTTDRPGRSGYFAWRYDTATGRTDAAPPAERAQISADGRWSNYVKAGVWSFDFAGRETRPLAVAHDGATPIEARFVRQSANKRYAVFTSAEGNLVPGEDNDFDDVFLRDLATGNNYKVSAASDGTPADYWSHDGVISANGQWVAFQSTALNLTDTPTDRGWKIVVAPNPALKP